MNIQRSTFNAQLPAAAHGCHPFGNWRWNVKCSVFVFFFTLPLYAQSDTNALPALAPPYGELPPTFWEQHQVAILVAGFAFLAFALRSLTVLLRPKPAVVLLPEVMARQALARWRNQPEDGRLLSEVSQILRRYLIVVFELPSAEMTTAEFCAALARNERNGMELAGAISSFLSECDVRKFSPAGSTTPVNAMDRALELISLAETRRKQPAGGSPDAIAPGNKRFP